MLNMTLSAIASATGAQLHGADQFIRSVSIDSRKLGAEALFVALPGEHVNGHDFVAAAAARGAVAALVQHTVDAALSQLQVADTTQALALIARSWRDEFNGKVIAITGSSGKTTTRSMLAAILAEAGKVSSTQGNLNNDLGVPLTLLSADELANFWVVEMGAAQKNDIARLMQMANPHISAITNIGSAHVGRFGSEAMIAEGKSEIYRDLRKDGVAVINKDDAYAQQWLALHKGSSLTWSVSGNAADVSATEIISTAENSRFTLSYQQQQVPVQLPVAGLHNVSNAVCAAACALAAGVPLALIAKGLAAFTGVAGRLQYKQSVHGARIIDDSYNANPSSVKAAIDVLAMQAGRRILVLGDMAELGDDAIRYHAQTGEYARGKVDLLLACGEQSLHTCKAFGEKAIHFSGRQQLADYLLSTSDKNDVILIKGSRSSAMDEVVRQLEQKAIA